LPRRKALLVQFSTAEWSKTVVRNVQHHDCAVQVCTPVLDLEIDQRMRVEVKLVRISNRAQTESQDFFFLPHQKIKNGSKAIEEAETVKDAGKAEEAETTDEVDLNLTFVAENSINVENWKSKRNNRRRKSGCQTTGKPSSHTETDSVSVQSLAIKDSSHLKVTASIKINQTYVKSCFFA
jgi:hypothetical protein